MNVELDMEEWDKNLTNMPYDDGNIYFTGGIYRKRIDIILENAYMCRRLMVKYKVKESKAFLESFYPKRGPSLVYLSIVLTN